MNPLQAFRRMIFAQVMVGLVAWCMAERNPGLLLMAGALGAMSWYVAEGPRRWNMPRWAVNLGAMLGVLLLGVELARPRADVVSAMGHFTLILQLLLLYGRKSPREYSQLMVLSLLQMVGASALSVSMIYGIFMVLYCVVAMLSVLLFHLVTAGDGVHQANLQAAADGEAPPPRPAAVAGRGAYGQLRLAAVGIGLVCAIVAVSVFVLVPRSGVGGPLNLGPIEGSGPRQTGFSDTVELGRGPLGSGSREPMLNLRVSLAGQDLGQDERAWLVRGVPLDEYEPTNATWSRSSFAQASDRSVNLATFDRVENVEPRAIYRADITLRDPRQHTVFTVVEPPTRKGTPSFLPLHIDAPGLTALQFSAVDHQMRIAETSTTATSYWMQWRGPMLISPAQSPPRLAPPSIDEVADEWLPRFQGRRGGDGPNRQRDVAPDEAADSSAWDPQESAAGEGASPGTDAFPLAMAEDALGDLWPRSDETSAEGSRSPSRWRPWPFSRSRENEGASHRITRQSYARNWEIEPKRVQALAVRILQDAGLSRDPTARHLPQDLEVAAALAEHLRKFYTYDMANPSVRGGVDPIISFLFQTRRGHCEYFAAGLAALCRSVGIPARLVTGFRASEFNDLGGYYVVRQSNAHAWTEVDGGPGVGWYSFDSTPAAEVRREHAVQKGLFASLRSVYEHLEFAWIKSVVAFDERSQEKVLGNVTASVRSARTYGGDFWQDWRTWLSDRAGLLTLEGLNLGLTVFILLGLGIALLIIVRLTVVRRGRIRALQLTALPPAERRGLARNLRFYLHMLDLLERHGHHRPTWQSPAEFARELSDAHPLRFGPVVALTDLFYELRFGRRPLDAPRRARVRLHLKQLEASFAES